MSTIPTAIPGGTAGLASGLKDAKGRAANAADRHTSGAENAAEKDKTEESSARKKFLDFMEKTPEQRMIEQWLNAHGMTKEEFDALPPEDKGKLLEEMKEDFKKQAREELEKKNPGITGAFVGGNLL